VVHTFQIGLKLLEAYHWRRDVRWTCAIFLIRKNTSRI